MFLQRLYDRSVKELRELKKKHEKNMNNMKSNIDRYKRYIEKYKDEERSVSEIEEVLEEKRLQSLEKDLVVNEDHKKLLREMYFEYYPKGSDYVFIGVNGKRPFGNSNVDNDVARILKWKLPNDDLSDKQRKKAWKLLEELPYALNKIIASI